MTVTESIEQGGVNEHVTSSEPLSASEEDAVGAAPTPEQDEPEREEPKSERKRLEEQLEALKRKELELRRALVVADNPSLADSIRELEGRAFALARVDAKLAQGLSKSEERRRETLAKKLASLREKRAELDAQIALLEAEHDKLGTERMTGFAVERAEAMKQLLVTLGTHEPKLRAAGIDPSSVVPEITRYLPEIEALAETLVAARERVDGADAQAS